ncbi:MAG TPA: hypothetical protein VK488_14000 [Gaiellaceae bacterium]|nr:hypothetical protein [Gaiellaceae bacterium]
MNALRAVGLFAVAGLLTVTASAATAPVPVKTSPRNETTPAASGDYFAWAKSRRGQPHTLDVYAQLGTEAPVKVNARRTYGWAGGIDGTRLAYQEVSKRNSNIRFFDLTTHRRNSPQGVNTKRWEWRPTISGDWLLFDRGVVFSGSKQQVILRNLVTGEQRVLDSLRSKHGLLQAGQVNGDFAVWMKCVSGTCTVFRYETTNQVTTPMPTTGQVQYGPSVTATGTTYYGRSGSECGAAAELVKTTIYGATEVLYSFPAGQDFGLTYATPVAIKPPGEISMTRIYFDRTVCSTERSDIYSIDDFDRLPPR